MGSGAYWGDPIEQYMDASELGLRPPVIAPNACGRSSYEDLLKEVGRLTGEVHRLMVENDRLTQENLFKSNVISDLMDELEPWRNDQE